MKRTKFILIRHAVLLAPNQVRFDRVKNFATPLVETLICQKLCIRKKPEQIVLLSIASSKSREKGFFLSIGQKMEEKHNNLIHFFSLGRLRKGESYHRKGSSDKSKRPQAHQPLTLRNVLIGQLKRDC